MANIAFLVEWFPVGGVERVIMNLAQPLTDRGHKVFLFVHCLFADKLSHDFPIEYLVLPYDARSSRTHEFVRESIIKHNIDIFISPGRFPKYLPKLREEGLCKLAFVLHGCPFYEIIQKVNSFADPNNMTMSKLLKHYMIDYPKLKMGYYHRKMRQRYHMIYDNVDAYGVLFEEYGRMVAKEIGVPYEESKCIVVHNPLPEFESKGEASQREKRVLFVGRLSYWDKRVDRLLDAWKLIYKDFPEWKLSIVGEGTDKDHSYLEKIVRENKLERVEFLGFVPAPEKLYSTSEILCLSSSIEGCPMVLLEAQAHGCATMAFDCSAGVRELLSPNWENGVYVPNGDIEAYAEALSKLMSDDELRQKIQRNGPESVKRFSVEASAEEYDALIQKLMA